MIKGNLKLRGIFKINLASFGMNKFCISFDFHATNSASIRYLISGGSEGGGEITILQHLSRSLLSSRMSTDYPFPIHHTMPFLMTSRAPKMLFQA